MAISFINRLPAGALFGLAALPFLFWPAVLNRYGVSFPIEDQWDTPYHAIIEAFAGRFNLGTYFVQHNEARKVLPTAISVAFAMLRGRWDVQTELYFGFFLCLVLVLLLYGLVRATPDLQRFDHAFLTFLFSWLLWSPLTWYFHTWSITLERLIAEAALLGGAWLSLGRLGLMRKAAGFAALAAAGQYSFPGGIVLWPLLGLLSLREAIQQRAFLALLAYGVSFALSTILFFTGYQHPPHHPPLSAIFEQSPAQIVGFFLIILGLPFADAPYVAAFLGGANLCLYALGIRRVWRCKQNDAVSWAWTVIGGYALSQALLATVGRLPMGMGHALRPDYITYGIYLLIAGSVLMRRAPLASGADRSSHLVLIAGGAMLGMAFLHAPSALKQMHARYHRLRADISCLQLMLAFPSERCPIAFYPDPELVLSRARSAHALGVLEFLPVTVTARTDDSLGFVDHHEPSPEGIRVRGWAAVDGTAADAVVFALSKNGGHRLSAVLSTGEARPDVAQTLGWNFAFSGWSGVIPTRPQEICDLQVYGFSAKKGVLVPLIWPRSTCR